MSSLASATGAAISGLKAQASSISSVSSNLANSSTTAYKTVNTEFEELVSDSTTSRTGTATSGVSYSTSSNNTAQGTIEAYSVDTYIAIDGNGYFPVAKSTTAADGSVTFSSDTYYTRAGDFTLDANGYLQNSSGYYLEGWTVDPETGAVDESSLQVIKISDLVDEPVATSTLEYVANIPASVATGTTTSSSNVTIYDSLGNEHAVSYTWTKTDTNTWDLTVTVADGAYDDASGTTSDYTTTISYTFDENGEVASIDDTGSGYTVSGNTVSFELNFEGAGSQTISSDFSDTTQFAGDSLENTVFSQDGVPAGSFDSLSIDSNGYVTVNYDNGVSKTYFQVPIATFNSANNLQTVSGNAYKATTTSGTASYHAAGDGGAGSISAESLESSATDIATEFTTMITAQRIYSANAKVVSTVDEMTKTLVDI